MIMELFKKEFVITGLGFLFLLELHIPKTREGLTFMP